MRLVQEIRKGFSSLEIGKALPLSEIENYPAYVVRIENSYGVIIEVPSQYKINERFSNVRYATQGYAIDGRHANFLYLSSNMEHLRNEFANICAAFVYPGENGTERKKIIKDPLSWWKNMKELLGNRNIDSSPYNVLGELIAYYYLVKTGNSVEWLGQVNGTADFESVDAYYEVKSTTMRYDSLIQISSQFQLQSEKDIKIFFLRFEESSNGKSIDDMVEMLVKLNVERHVIEESLICGGYEKHSIGRSRRYKLLEMREYDVKKDFPAVVREDFDYYGIPNSNKIVKITYTVDLNGLDFQQIPISFLD